MLQNNIDSLESERVEKESILVSTQWKLQRLMDEVNILVQDKQSIQMQLYQSQVLFISLLILILANM